ncbi:MAG: hypothetical protein R3Y45_07515 [Bacillota bacterium]
MQNKNFNRLSRETVKTRKTVSQNPPIKGMDNKANPNQTPRPQKEIKQQVPTDNTTDRSTGTDIFNLPKSDFEKMNT